MRAVIMAGGKSTRLTSVAKDIPKPMFPILGKPILDYQIESLKKSGITEITVFIGHFGEVIQQHLGGGQKHGVHIDYIVEAEPLGTAGALYFLKSKIEKDFVLVFGDLIFDVDFNRFMDFHKKHGATISLYGHPNAHPYDSDVIIIDEENRVTSIFPKNDERAFFYHNFVNAGLYCVSPKVLETIKVLKKIDLEKTIITEQIKLGNVFAYKSTEYVKDMGTPDRLNTVVEDVKNGVVSGRSLKQKQRAIFLDRDGTINEYVGFLTETVQFKLLSQVAEAIAKINTSPYLTIVVTNQPVIARGECTFDELENIHKKMETELGRRGAYVDDIFFCPHHPHKGYAGEVPELKFECECRKPKIGMLRQASERYNIDLSQSYYIGDTTMDIQTGINAGMRTVLVSTGEAGNDRKYDVKPDFAARDLLEAITMVLGHGNMDRESMGANDQEE